MMFQDPSPKEVRGAWMKLISAFAWGVGYEAKNLAATATSLTSGFDQFAEASRLARTQILDSSENTR